MPRGKVRVYIDFPDLKDTRLIDSYRLPSIDKLLSQTTDHEKLSLVSFYAIYNQIHLAKEA